MFQNYRLIIFDADGTLRRCTVPGQLCPNKPGEWELIPGVKKRLAKISWGSPHVGKTAIGIASNQAGTAYGYLDIAMAHRLIRYMVHKAIGIEPPTGGIQVCPHAIEDDCNCRKPKPQMLQRLMDMWLASPQETLFVGDMESDQLAAENAGVDFVWAWEFFGWAKPDGGRDAGS